MVSIFYLARDRQAEIMKQWKALLQQLQQQKEHVGDVMNALAVLRDIQLISLDLKELQVNKAKFIERHILTNNSYTTWF